MEHVILYWYLYLLYRKQQERIEIRRKLEEKWKFIDIIWGNKSTVKTISWWELESVWSIIIVIRE
jgi:hypothetical protein